MTGIFPQMFTNGHELMDEDESVEGAETRSSRRWTRMDGDGYLVRTFFWRDETLVFPWFVFFVAIYDF